MRGYTALSIPQKILSTLYSYDGDEKYYTVIRLAKATDSTYSHITNIIQVFEDQGLVRSERVGRIKKVYLTAEGIIAARGVEALKYGIQQAHRRSGTPQAQVREHVP